MPGTSRDFDPSTAGSTASAGARRSPAAGRPPHVPQRLVHPERLGHIVVGAGVECCHLVSRSHADGTTIGACDQPRRRRSRRPVHRRRPEGRRGIGGRGELQGLLYDSARSTTWPAPRGSPTCARRIAASSSTTSTASRRPIPTTRRPTTVESFPPPVSSWPVHRPSLRRSLARWPVPRPTPAISRRRRPAGTAGTRHGQRVGMPGRVDDADVSGCARSRRPRQHAHGARRVEQHVADHVADVGGTSSSTTSATTSCMVSGRRRRRRRVHRCRGWRRADDDLFDTDRAELDDRRRRRLHTAHVEQVADDVAERSVSCSIVASNSSRTSVDQHDVRADEEARSTP